MRCEWISVLLAVAAGACMAAEPVVVQPLTLKAGWNAVYLGVKPTQAPDAFFADWPVTGVSVYRSAQARQTAETINPATGETLTEPEFLTWQRGLPVATTLSELNGDQVLVCFNTNGAPWSTSVMGVPVAPRIAWHRTDNGSRTNLNYVGTLLTDGGSVAAKTYFAGETAGKLDYWRLGGTDSSAPVKKAFLGAATLTSGEALLVSATKLSDWSGPLYVEPIDGFDFGSKYSTGELRVRNDGATVRKVRLSLLPSADETLAKPDLLWRDGGTATNPVWSAWTAPLERALTTGETWRIALAFDRSKLKASAVYGAIAQFEDLSDAKALVRVPITAEGAVWDGGTAENSWAAGLWQGEVALAQVSFYKNDATRVDNVAAGGKMKLRLLVHVDANGKARLLQRVAVAGTQDDAGNVSYRLYAGSSTVPSGYTVARRISAVALPVDVPVTEGTGGVFAKAGASLRFAYRVGASSPSNPFYHTLHPQFDNLQADFKTPAPDGDDVNNYVGSVKPERFGFDGQVALSFDANGGTAWSPEETLTGDCTWTLTGLRREGPLHAQGTFTLTRISTVAELVW